MAAKKTFSAAQLTTIEQKHALPTGWLANLLAKYGPVILNFLLSLLGEVPAPTPAAGMKAPKDCPTPDDCCGGACIHAALGIMGMHQGDCNGAAEAFFAATLYASRACDPDCKPVA